MLAAILTELNAPLTLADIEPPELDYGQVLVQLSVSGICGAQLQEIRGEKGNAKFLPHLLGHEGCGIVRKAGVGVTRVKSADKVVLHWRKAAGIEALSPKYQGNLEPRTIGAGPVTTFNEWAVVSENRCTAVPDETPDELCALLGCGLSTALGTIENEAKLLLGESVLILGLGGLGVNLIRAARLRGASEIVAVDQTEDKAALARALGAGYARNFIPNRKFDVIVDTTGSREVIATALPVLAGGGRFILVGQPKPDTSVEIFNARHLFDGEGKTIMATQGGRFRPDADLPRYTRLHAAGRLDLTGIVSERLPLSDINRGLDLVRAGGASRVMIEMG